MTSAGARSRLRSQPRRANGLAAASRLASFSDGVRNDVGAGALKVGGLGRTLDHRADFGACLEERLDDEASVGASRIRYEDHGRFGSAQAIELQELDEVPFGIFQSRDPYVTIVRCVLD